MAGYWRFLVVCGMLLAGQTTSVQASDGCFGLWYVPSMASYYAPYAYSWSTPVYYYYPSSRSVTVIPLDGSSYFANPIPAPPSPTKEPPLDKKQPSSKKKESEAANTRPPAIITTRSLSAASSLATAPKERCRIGFWNLSGREVTLTVEGKNWTLAKDRSLTLELARQFVWQTDQGPQHAEHIPDHQAAHELIIRE